MARSSCGAGRTGHGGRCCKQGGNGQALMLRFDAGGDEIGFTLPHAPVAGHRNGKKPARWMVGCEA